MYSILIGIFIGIMVVMGITAANGGYDGVEEIAIKKYVESRGATPVPRTWKEKIGEGI